MTTILVTGGAGYIGSHTCKALANVGLIPVTYDNLSTGHPYAVKWGPLVIGDLRDRKQLDLAFKQYKPKGVLHFAASALVIESMTNPGKYYNNNVSGSISLLETMVENQVPHLVFSSTCATYGHPQFSPITEEHPQNPINPYGRSKLMVEHIIQDFEKTHNLHSVTLRYFNAAGADLEAEIGENHTPETHLIPSVIEVAQGLRKELVVYGTNFPTPDGSAVRDYIHVEDLAKAHVSALQWLFTNNRSTMINLGTGTGSSVLEIVRAVEAISKNKIPVRFEKKREGEPSHLVADNKKAKHLIHWTPVTSSLPHLIETAWKWHNTPSSSMELKGVFNRC
jgi:UDP-arabinose 4-epimerase